MKAYTIKQDGKKFTAKNYFLLSEKACDNGFVASNSGKISDAAIKIITDRPKSWGKINTEVYDDETPYHNYKASIENSYCSICSPDDPERLRNSIIARIILNNGESIQELVDSIYPYMYSCSVECSEYDKTTWFIQGVFKIQIRQLTEIVNSIV